MQCDEPLVTVCLPPWQVKRLVTLCLRSMRKYYLITYSNVIVRREALLSRMIELLVRNPNCAGYGYDKLKMKSPLRNLARRSLDTKRARLWMRKTLLGNRTATFRNVPKQPRDFCALYRTDLLREYPLSFVPNVPPSIPGEFMYHQLTGLGYAIEMVPVHEMRNLIDHVEHGTSASHAAKCIIPKASTQHKAERRLEQSLNKTYTKALANPAELDGD